MINGSTDEVRAIDATLAAYWPATFSPMTATTFAFAASFAPCAHGTRGTRHNKGTNYANYGKKHGCCGTWRSIG